MSPVNFSVFLKIIVTQADIFYLETDIEILGIWNWRSRLKIVEYVDKEGSECIGTEE